MKNNQSTGPRSVEGKAVSRLNALKTGIYAKAEVVLPAENPDDLENLTAEYYDRFASGDPEQRAWSTRSSRTNGFSAASEPSKLRWSPAKCVGPSNRTRNPRSARRIEGASKVSNASSAASTPPAAITARASNSSPNS